MPAHTSGARARSHRALAAALAFLLATAGAFATTPTASAQQSVVVEGIMYEIDAGAETATAIGYDGAGGILLIPDSIAYSGTSLPVTTIAASAFRGIYNFSDVIIGSNVSEIGMLAFGEAYSVMDTAFWFTGPAPARFHAAYNGSLGGSTRYVYFPYQYEGTGPGQYTRDTWMNYRTSAPYAVVTFDTTGGSSLAASRVPLAQPASEPAAPTRDGYTFTGWFTDPQATTSYDFATSVEGNLILFAGWAKEVTPPVDTPPTWIETLAGSLSTLLGPVG